MYTPLPVYKVPKEKKRNTKAAKKASAEKSRPATANNHGSSSHHHLFQSIRRGSVAETFHSHHTNSSGKSSLLPAAERPSWENGLEVLNLSRRSSQRSTTSSMPSRERPESVQIFGKTIFNRRGKLRRENSDHGSSNESQNSAEAPADPGFNAPQDQHMMNSMMAAVRRNGKMDDEAARRFNISGPYNFQHVAHTEKNKVPENSRSNRTDLLHNFSEIRYDRGATTHPSTEFHDQGPHHTSPPSVNRSRQQDPSAGWDSSLANHEWRNREPTSPPAVPMRSLKRTQSSEQMRDPPPRPPRPAPFEVGPVVPIPPPPRRSSRSTRPPESLHARRTINTDRQPHHFIPQQPGSFVLPASQPTVRPMLSGNGAPIEQYASTNHRVSHVVGTSEDVAWPLSPDAAAALPDVLEEEESNGFHRSRSRISLASNSSSLRGSVSVPLLRQVAQAQGQSIPRPPSNASETLGRFDLFAAQRALRANADDDSIYDELPKESWEDDIDYCYDHEADADFDYAWERASCDLSGEDDLTQMLGKSRLAYPCDSPASSQLLSPPGQDDVPALSPVSQVSVNAPSEARTPTVMSLPTASNFSLPRRDSSALTPRVHLAPGYQADGVDEGQDFKLSPALLVPNDYYQQMLLHERQGLREEDEDLHVAPLSASSANLSKSAKLARSSASTTDSAFSDRSGFSTHRKSATSASTTMTRWTSTSTTATVDGWQPTSDDKDYHIPNFGKKPISPLPELDETRHQPRESSPQGHLRAQSHADVQLVKSHSEIAINDKTRAVKENIKARRRAKTTSRSHNNTPVALALFPPSLGGRI